MSLGVEADHLKRKLRQLKKLEAEIRFKGRTLTGNESFVWNQYFSTGRDKKQVRYPLERLVEMDKQDYKDVIAEYFSMVYFVHYKESGILPRNLYDPELLRELDLPPDSTSGDIKRRFRELAKKYHPDHGGDGKKFITFMDTYKRLVEK